MKRNGHRGRRGQRRTAGFSLIEVIVVLLLLALLCFSVIVGSRNTHAEVTAETGILRGHVRFLQTMAMANNTAVWSLEITSASYTLLRDDQPAPINLPDESAPARILPAGVRIVQGLGRHAFDEWGVPDQDLTIVLSDGQQQRQVTVLAFTGFMP